MTSTLTARIRAIRTNQKPCAEATAWMDALPADTTDQQAWDACPRSDWMLELLALTEPDPARFRLCVCAIARTALQCVPAGGDRLRIAIETAERYARGEATDEELAAAWGAVRGAAWADGAAARAVAGAAARAVAWGAAKAVAWGATGGAAWAVSAAAWAAALRAQADIVHEWFPDAPSVPSLVEAS